MTAAYAALVPTNAWMLMVAIIAAGTINLGWAAMFRDWFAPVNLIVGVGCIGAGAGVWSLL